MAPNTILARDRGGATKGHLELLFGVYLRKRQKPLRTCAVLTPDIQRSKFNRHVGNEMHRSVRDDSHTLRMTRMNTRLDRDVELDARPCRKQCSVAFYIILESL